MTLLKRLGLILPAWLFAATLLIAGCTGGSNSGVSGGDLDKDGIVDQHDLDIDGDGIPNESDPAPGSNGVMPPNPKVACSAARIIVPNDELRAGTLTTLKWELLPEGCGVSSDTPLATEYAHVVNRGGLEDTKSKPVSPGALGAEIRIPAACGGEGEKIAVTYDIMEVGVALGDAKLSKGAYTQTVDHPVPPCGSTGAGLPDIDDIPMCPDDVTPINDAKDNCTCPEGEEYNGETNSCEASRCSFDYGSLGTALNDYIAGGGYGKYKDGSAYAHCGLIGTWDVSAVKNMGGLFKRKETFNEDISGWDVSNVWEMSEMFYLAKAFNNGGQPLNWDVSGVTNMNEMFYSALAFNQDISGWNVSRNKYWRSTFSYATSFNQDLSGWTITEPVQQLGGFDNRADSWDCGKRPPRLRTCTIAASAIAASSNDLDGDGIPNG
ncbi:MAG: BspA family leucine-rich repeat surface protein, partial [Halieaceae bacterium]